jgi:hypothetical protein
VELEAGNDVVMVLHSMGGFVGVEAVNKLLADEEEMPGERQGIARSVKIIFISAYLFLTNVVMDARTLSGPANPGLSINVRLPLPIPIVSAKNIHPPFHDSHFSDVANAKTPKTTS